MATLDELSTALRNADAAGDVNAARALAAEITRMRGQVTLGDVASSAWSDIKKFGEGLKTLPQRAFGASEQMRTEGEYNPAPMIEAASLGPMTPKAVAPRMVPATIPTRQALEEAATGGFERAKNMGVDLAPQGIAGVGNAIERSLWDKGIHEEHAPATYKTLSRILNPPEGAVVTVSDLHNLRQAFGNAAGSASHPKDALAGSLAKAQLDRYISAIPEKDIVAGPAAGASKELTDAIGNSAAAFRSGRIEDAATAAELSAAAANSGRNIGNATRQKFKSVLLGDEAAGFNPQEIAQLDRTVRGTKTGNTARYIGNALGGGGGIALPVASAIGASTGAVLGGGPAWAAVGASVPPILGNLARILSNASTDRQVRLLDEMSRARSPLAKSTEMAVAPLSPAEASRAALIRALMLQQQQ